MNIPTEGKSSSARRQAIYRLSIYCLSYVANVANSRADVPCGAETYPRRIVRRELLPDVSAKLSGFACLEYRSRAIEPEDYSPCARTFPKNYG